MALELQRLHYFVTVADCLNFSAAARRMHLTVPTLSRQIIKLEEELDVQLLTRNRRRVALTPAGELLLREATTLLSQAENIEHSVRLAHKGDVGSVRIGIGLGLASSISPVLVEHGQAFPGVQLQCGEIFSDEQEDALRERRIDVGFTRAAIDTTKMRVERLFDEELVVLLNRESPLAKSKPKSLRLKDLVNETLLLHERHTAGTLYDKILELYSKAGITPKIFHQGPLIQYPVMVAAGKGVAIGVERVHSKSDPMVMAVPLAEAGAKICVQMAWRKDENSASVLAFLNSARRAFVRNEASAEQKPR